MIKNLLMANPKHRFSAKQALDHFYFTDRPRPAECRTKE